MSACLAVYIAFQFTMFQILKDIYKKLSYATEELAAIQKAYQDVAIIAALFFWQKTEIAEILQLEEEFGISINGLNS